MRSPLVSIITPTYNHAKVIGQCLKSVLEQTCGDWEMLIMDDGSIDETAEIVRAHSDPRIRYYRQPHRGISSLGELCNHALGLTRGELIAIVEGDDYWPSDKLERSVHALSGSKAVLFYGLTQLCDHSGQPLPEWRPTPSIRKNFGAVELNNNPVGSAARGMLISHSLWTNSVSSVIRRRTLERVGGFLTIPQGSLIDRPTFFALALRGEFLFEESVMGYWRQHSHNSTKNLPIWREICSGLIRYLDVYMRDHGATLGLHEDERAAILRYWQTHVVQTWIGEGRTYLIKKQWSQARRCFLEGLMAAGWRRQGLSAVAGCLASYVHKDLETGYRLLGRQSRDVRQI